MKKSPVWPAWPLAYPGEGYQPTLGEQYVAEAQRDARRVLPPKNLRFTRGGGKDVSPKPHHNSQP